MAMRTFRLSSNQELLEQNKLSKLEIDFEKNLKDA
jgi:hypothetical protein